MVKKCILFMVTLVVLCSAYPQAQACFNSAEVGIPILMYHNISPKARLKGAYCVSVNEFENDLKYIVDNGYTTVSMKQLIDYSNGMGDLPEKPIVITFDDGQESFYTYAFPLLKKYGCCAVMSIVGSYTDFYTSIDDHNVDYSYLTWQEVKELYDSGIVEIGNHTYNMHEINNLRKGCGIKKGEDPLEYCNELNEDIGKLQSRIKDFTGETPTIFAYPYGYISKETPDIIKEMGFSAVLTCSEKVNYTTKQDWIYNLGRYNRASGISTQTFFKKFEKNA